MTTSKVINFPSEAIVWNNARLAETLAKIATTVEESKAKAGKAPLTLQAPTLSALELNEKAPKPEKKETYLEALMSYMASVLVYGTEMNSVQMESISMQRTVADLQMTIIKQIEKVTQEQISKAHNNPWKAFVKIFSYIAGGLMVVAGLLTGNPMLVIGGLFAVTTTATGAGEELNKALAKLPTAGKIFAILGIAVAAAVVVSLAGAALSPAAAAAAAGEAAGSAATVGAEAGAVAAAEVGAAAGAAEASAAEGAEAGAAAGTSTGVTAGQIAARTLLIGAMLNLFGEIFKGFAQAAKASKKAQADAELAGGVIGSVLAMAVACKVENFSATASTVRASTNMTNALTAVRGMQTITAILTAVFNILEGTSELKAAKRMLEASEAKAALELFTHLFSQNNEVIKSDEAAINASAKGFARMNGTWDSYVAPYRTGVENMA